MPHCQSHLGHNTHEDPLAPMKLYLDANISQNVQKTAILPGGPPTTGSPRKSCPEKSLPRKHTLRAREGFGVQLSCDLTEPAPSHPHPRPHRRTHLRGKQSPSPLPPHFLPNKLRPGQIQVSEQEPLDMAVTSMANTEQSHSQLHPPGAQGEGRRERETCHALIKPECPGDAPG